MKRRLIAACATAAAATALLSLAIAAPLLESTEHPVSPMVARLLLAPICHQIPGRSFSIGGSPLGVCARCIGLYGGFAAGSLFLAGLALVRRRGAPASPPARPVLIAAALPTALEWALEMSRLAPGLSPGAGTARALTGAGLSFVVAFYFVPALEEMGREFAAEVRWLLPAPPLERSHAERS